MPSPQRATPAAQRRTPGRQRRTLGRQRRTPCRQRGTPCRQRGTPRPATRDAPPATPDTPPAMRDAPPAMRAGVCGRPDHPTLHSTFSEVARQRFKFGTRRYREDAGTRSLKGHLDPRKVIEVADRKDRGRPPVQECHGIAHRPVRRTVSGHGTCAFAASFILPAAGQSPLRCRGTRSRPTRTTDEWLRPAPAPRETPSHRRP